MFADVKHENKFADVKHENIGGDATGILGGYIPPRFAPMVGATYYCIMVDTSIVPCLSHYALTQYWYQYHRNVLNRYF